MTTYLRFVRKMADLEVESNYNRLRCLVGLAAEMQEFEDDSNESEACDVLFWLTALSDYNPCMFIFDETFEPLPLAWSTLRNRLIDLAEKVSRPLHLRKADDFAELNLVLDTICLQFLLTLDDLGLDIEELKRTSREKLEGRNK
jgi:hypothetical protein